jgi:Transglutaminase-like superfamily
VRDQIRYTSDVVDTETLQPPALTLSRGYGDCDDQSMLLAALLMSIGIPAVFCAIATHGGPFSHVMSMAVLRTGDGVIYQPCETTVARDPKTGAAIGPGWWPDDVTETKVFHI